MLMSLEGYSNGSSSRCPGDFNGQYMDGSNSVLLDGGVARSGDTEDSEISDRVGEGTVDEGA